MLCVEPALFSVLTTILHTPYDHGSSGWKNHPPGFSPAFSFGESCEPRGDQNVILQII